MKTISCMSLVAMLSATFSCITVSQTDLVSYELNGDVSEMKVEVEVGELDYIVYFSSHARIDSIVHLSVDGTVRDREIHSYDFRSRRVRVTEVDREGTQEGWYDYEYDGTIIKTCIFYGMNSEQFYRWEHVNDGVSIVESRFYNDGELQYTDRREYDALNYRQRRTDVDGNLLEDLSVTQFSEGKPSSIVGGQVDISVDYDSSGLPVHCKNVVLSSKAELGWYPELEENPERWYNYSFDDRGNWVCRTEHCTPDGPPVNTVRRTITYR